MVFTCGKVVQGTFSVITLQGNKSRYNFGEIFEHLFGPSGLQQERDVLAHVIVDRQTLAPC